jgi:hypothetical protein
MNYIKLKQNFAQPQSKCMSLLITSTYLDVGLNEEPPHSLENAAAAIKES